MNNGNLENLLQEINKECEKLHNKYYINWGGCCFVAYVIAKNLEKLHIRYKLAIADYDFEFEKPSSLSSRRAIKERNGNYTEYNTYNHYYILVNNIKINSGRHNNKDSHFIGCIKSEDIKYLYDNGCWNSDFKKRYKPIVEKRIVKIFNDYEKRFSC